MAPSRIRLLFDRALTVEAEQRSAWLEQVCGGDPALREAVTALIEAAEDDVEVGRRVIDEATRSLLAETPGASDHTERLRALRRMLDLLRTDR